MDEEEDAAVAGVPPPPPPRPPSLLATWTMTLPVRIPLKMAMASECDRPDVEWPFTDRISSPEAKEREGFQNQIHAGEREAHDGRFG